MVVLPLKCKRCNWETEIRSDEPLPGCLYCGGNLSPNGKPRQWTEADAPQVSEMSTVGLLGDALIADELPLMFVFDGKQKSTWAGNFVRAEE